MGLLGLVAWRWEDGSLPGLMICPPMDSMPVAHPHLSRYCDWIWQRQRLEEGGMVIKLHFWTRVLVT
jgi:hypothetical protein